MARKGTSSDRRSDADLVHVCNYGDSREAARAFEALYDRHKNYVIRVALRFSSDHDSALDVLQETFSYLLRKFPPTGQGLTLNARLTSLLYTVAKNCAITLMRKSERFPSSDGLQPDDLPSKPVPEQNDVAAALRELSAERREVITMRFVDDLSLQEIADVLQIPLGTVKSRLHLGIRQLRDSPETKNFFDS